MSKRRNRGLVIVNCNEVYLGIPGKKNRYSVILKENASHYLVTIITSLEDKSGNPIPNKIRKLGNTLLLEIDCHASNLRRRSAVSIQTHRISKGKVRHTNKRTAIQDKVVIYRHVFVNTAHNRRSRQNRNIARRFDRNKVKQK